MLKKYFTMSNALIRAAHRLSLPEKRIIAMAISGLDSRDAETEQCREISINAQAYSELYGVEITVAYKQLKEAGKNLFDRYIHFYNEKKTQETYVRWVGSCKWDDDIRGVVLDFYWKVIPHLINLQKNFTTYNLNHATGFKTVYTWRLYEFIKSWERLNKATAKVTDFAEIMDAPDYCRKDFTRFRTNVIDPAIKELTEKYKWQISYQAVKEGRKYIKIDFKFRTGELKSKPKKIIDWRAREYAAMYGEMPDEFAFEPDD